MSVLFNNRDHRKMMIIDGNVGFIGGMDLADEYINRVERYGYWKDTVVRLKGEAVWSLTLMFLTMWEYVGGEKEDIIQEGMIGLFKAIQNYDLTQETSFFIPI